MTTTESLEDLRDAVEAALLAAGGELLHAEFARQDVSPHGILTRFDARIRFGESELAVPVFAETAATEEPRPGVTRVGDGEHMVDVWAYPNDPALPALPTVTTAGAADVVLGRLGIPAEYARMTVVAYRPGKRAVVRLETGDAALFVKVVPPAMAQTLHEKHVRWREAGLPVPQSAGWSSFGLVALEALPGVEAASRIEEVDDDALLDLVADAARRIAAVAEPTQARPSLASRLDWYVAAVSSLAPEHAGDTARLARRIDATLTAHPCRTPAVIHGDLHLSQLLVPSAGPLEPLGLLDIDTAGIGDPADDVAALTGHAIASACGSRDHAGRRDRWLGIALAALHRSASTDAGDALRARAIVAVHLLGHALAGALPVGEALRLANDVLDERPLTSVS